MTYEVKFTWRDHLRGIWSIISVNRKLSLRMRIKYLNASGYGDENGMVQVLRHQLAIIEKGESKQ